MKKTIITLTILALLFGSGIVIRQVMAGDTPADAKTLELINSITGEDVAYVGKDRAPSPNVPDADLSKYESGNFYFLVDDVSQQVISMMPIDDMKSEYSTEPPFSKEQLEQMALDFAAQAAPGLSLEGLDATVGEKEETNYFFRWTDNKNLLPDGTPAHLQVAISQGGTILNFVNFLPFRATQ